MFELNINQFLSINRIKNYIITILFLNLWVSLNAQKNVTVSGYVTDANTGEHLYTATIFDSKSLKGTVANRYGFYSISLPKDSEIQLIYSFVGYRNNHCSFYLNKDTTINTSLISSNQIEEVTIQAKKLTKRVHGHQKIQMSDLEKLPSFLGEKDVIKSLMLLPGVQQGNEGSSGIYVRGGSPDQNLILLDDVPLYNVSHLFGFVSVFTPEALQSVDFYKGAFPARFGGRLSSIIDVRMKDGNKYDNKTDVTLGMLSSKIIHEGPLKKGKSSYVISARRTLLDLLVTNASRIMQKSNKETTTPGYGFYDINAKANFQLNPSNHLHFSFYAGGDKLFVNYREKFNTLIEERHQKNNVQQKWGNTIAAIKWNSKITPKLFMNLSSNWSRFFYKISNDFYGKFIDENRNEENEFSLNYDSRIVSLGLKADFDYYLSSKIPIGFGGFAYHHNYLPGVQEVSRNGEVNRFSAEELGVWEYGSYFDIKFPITNKFFIKTGMRSMYYSTKEKVFSFIEPRMIFSYDFERLGMWSASYTRMSQPIHLLTSSNIGLPSDIWVPSTKKIKPEQSSQYTVGINNLFLLGMEIDLEAYYKTMSNVIAYSQGFGLMDLNEDWEDYVEKGLGRAWGIETQIKYKFSKLDSWLGYTLSWNNRKFENINHEKWFPYKFDRRHKLDLGFIYKIGKNWTFSTNWTYQSGVPVSLTGIDYQGYPGNIDYGWHDIFTGVELEDADRILYYPELNKTRLPAYHRLDFSFIKEWKVRKQIRQLSLGVFNVYSRQNPYFVYPEVTEQGNTVYKQVSLIPVLPSISYRIRF